MESPRQVQDKKLDDWLKQSFPCSDPLPLTPLPEAALEKEKKIDTESSGRESDDRTQENKVRTDFERRPARESIKFF